MASIMLVAFASCALIPPGFMPASGRPFSLEICREGLPPELLAHVEPSHADSAATESMGMDMSAGSMAADPVGDSMSHRGLRRGAHHHQPSQSEHCVFGTACGAGPAPHLRQPSDFSSAEQLRPVTVAALALAVRVVHLPQPRAPPSRLS